MLLQLLNSDKLFAPYHTDVAEEALNRSAVDICAFEDEENVDAEEVQHQSGIDVGKGDKYPNTRILLSGINEPEEEPNT